MNENTCRANRLLSEDFPLKELTVYFVPLLGRHPLRVIATCEDVQDAHDIAKFFRDRDKAYTYVSTDASGEPTVWESLD